MPAGFWVLASNPYSRLIIPGQYLQETLKNLKQHKRMYTVVYAHGNIVTRYRLGTMSQQTSTIDFCGEGLAAASRQNEMPAGGDWCRCCCPRCSRRRFVRAPSNFRRDVQQDRPPRATRFAEKQRQNFRHRDRSRSSAGSLSGSVLMCYPLLFCNTYVMHYSMSYLVQFSPRPFLVINIYYFDSI